MNMTFIWFVNHEKAYYNVWFVNHWWFMVCFDKGGKKGEWRGVK